MKRIISSRWLDYPEDVVRICKVALDHNYYITPLEAQVMWVEYSDSLAAGWLILPKSDDEIWRNIKHFLDEEL